jgi:probable F420-dependent oxidoreductase
MTVELGRIGVWQHPTKLPVAAVVELEKLGYGAVWLGGSPDASLDVVDPLLEATDHIAVATGIVNMWKDDARPVAESYHRLARRYPGRFLLGVGIGHPEATQEYVKPYDKMVSYLDELDAAGVPREGMALAALGPKALKLSAERTAGAHPYLTTPEHTRQARELVGDGVLLAPEQKVVLDTDEQRARATGRSTVEFYLGLRNYVNNLRRLGFTDEDLTKPGSDRLVDELALHGDAATVARGVTAHLDAGADHVCVQVLGEDVMSGYRSLAEVLFS